MNTNNDYDDALMDLRLKAFKYAVYSYARKEAEITGLKMALDTYGVGSPRIKNQFEALYISPERPAGESRGADMIMDKMALEEETKELKGFIEDTLFLLQTLTDEQLQLVYEYYDIGRTAQQIGDRLGLSKEQVKQRLHKIREDLNNE